MYHVRNERFGYLGVGWCPVRVAEAMLRRGLNEGLLWRMGLEAHGWVGCEEARWQTTVRGKSSPACGRELAQYPGSMRGLGANYPAWRATGSDGLLGQPKPQFRVAHKDTGQSGCKEEFRVSRYFGSGAVLAACLGMNRDKGRKVHGGGEAASTTLDLWCLWCVWALRYEGRQAIPLRPLPRPGTIAYIAHSCAPARTSPHHRNPSHCIRIPTDLIPLMPPTS